MAGRGLLLLSVSSLLIHCCCVQLTAAQAYRYDYLEEDCRLNRSLDLDLAGPPHYGFVRVTKNKQYAPDLHCSLTVWAPKDHRLTVRIRRVDISCAPGHKLTITGSNESEPMEFCGRSTPSYSISSLTRKLTFQFESDDTYTEGHVGFDLHYTAFHRDGCESGEFRCKFESRCIPEELTCDNMDNCGDWSDERHTACGLSTGAIVSISLVCILVAGTCLGFCIYFYTESQRKKKERHRTHAADASVEYIRSPTAGGGGGAEAPPHMYGLGAEPPPPYTYQYKIPERTTAATTATTTDFASNPLYATQNTTSQGQDQSRGLVNPVYDADEATGSSPTEQYQAAPNIPPPAYEEVPKEVPA